MIIVGLSAGLANQIYEYAAAYALAKELQQELVLDISACIKSSRGYMLDFFSIPDTRKILYCGNDSEHYGNIDLKRLPQWLRESVTIFTSEKPAGGGIKKYNGLDDLKNMGCYGDIYLFGYFFDRKKYYNKYWNEIKSFFSLKVEIKEVEMFRNLIKNKISVGVHIRRGDMLLTDWAEKMEDGYYRAAIEYCKRYIGECSFFIFSDDINYAKKMLGKDSALWYVNFGGSQEADIAEFICLSLCDHRILSNSSTFSILADELNTNEEKKTFYQASKTVQTTWVDQVKKAIWLKILRKPWSRVDLDEWDIKKYGRHYQQNNLDNIPNYQKRKEKLLNITVSSTNYEWVLDEISGLSFNVYERTAEEESRFLYQKFIALVIAGKYHSALAVKERIYEDYINDRMFRESLIDALMQIGAYKEAEMERNRTSEAKHFIIVPAGKSDASEEKFGSIELGIVLHHFGHKVSLILEPVDKTERHYIMTNEMLTDRQCKSLGCKQYLQEMIEQEGLEGFLRKLQEDELFVVTRKKDFCGKKFDGKSITYVFPDFMDWRDEESKVGERMQNEDIKFLYDNADFILSHDESKKDDTNYIIWTDNDCSETYRMVDRRWQLGDLDRLSERTICMAEALLERLNGGRLFNND